MNWHGYGRKRSWPNLKHSLRIFQERLRKDTTKFSLDGRCPGEIQTGQLHCRYRLGQLAHLWTNLNLTLSSNSLYGIRFEVLTAVTSKSTVIWYVTPCSLVCWQFGGRSVSFYLTTRHHIPEDSTINYVCMLESYSQPNWWCLRYGPRPLIT
jgi:hypothetical protein